jgi:DNA polymerase-3 subunit alpha
MDFLGLRNLTIIKNCVTMIKKDYPNFELPTEYNDVSTFQMITSGDTTGVFQLESEGMRQTLRQMCVESFEDICSALALYRPGPMEMIPEFVNRKKGKEKITYLHKDLENILKPTHGIIVYQDQIMLIAWKFAGYSLGEADVLRRAVSKKKKDVLIKEKNKFVTSSMNKGYSKEVAEEIYEYILKFANYGFNKAHSVAYSVIAYLTAYLKCHYPSYYFSVLLNSVIGTNNLLANYISEISKRNIKVEIPNINISDDSFKVINNTIVMPLTAIDGLGPSYVNEILNERKVKPFDNFEDFINRISDKLTPQLIENIIYSGALGCFGLTKKTMIDNYGTLSNRKKYAFVKNLTTVVYDNEEFSYGYLLEKELKILGINLRYNFMYQYEGYFRKKMVRKISDIKLGRVSILGIVTRIREIKTKNDTKMFFADIKDDTGNVGLTIFPKLYLDFVEVQVGTVIMVTGNLEERNSEKQIVVESFRII